MGEIEKLAALGGSEINEAKKVLATEATALLHGRDAANEAAETARHTFEEGALAESLPTVEIPRGELEAGLGVLAPSSRRASSPPMARRGARSRAAACASTTSPSPTRRWCCTPPTLTPEGVIKLSLGKKRHVLLKPA